MRWIKMTGGLGNQMFIYAMYLQMRKQFKHTYIDLSDMVHYRVHHGYEMNRVFALPKVEICINQTIKKVVEFLFFQTILERKQNGNFQAYQRRYLWPLVYFKGFYQSERYFLPIADEVRKAFTFDMSLANSKSIEMVKVIDNDPCAVSLHLRRGDYLKPEHWNSIGCVCQLPYYQNAVNAMNSRFERTSYYVFSDDIEWVKSQLKLPKAIYIDWNKGADSWQDMMLMSHCKHHIICNSTFSWWGAWLNPCKNKIVMMPERWLNQMDTPNIYPEGWIKVPIH